MVKAGETGLWHFIFKKVIFTILPVYKILVPQVTETPIFFITYSLALYFFFFPFKRVLWTVVDASTRAGGRGVFSLVPAPFSPFQCAVQRTQVEGR